MFIVELKENYWVQDVRNDLLIKSITGNIDNAMRFYSLDKATECANQAKIINGFHEPIVYWEGSHGELSFKTVDHAMTEKEILEDYAEDEFDESQPTLTPAADILEGLSDRINEAMQILASFGEHKDTDFKAGGIVPENKEGEEFDLGIPAEQATNLTKGLFAEPSIEAFPNVSQEEQEVIKETEDGYKNDQTVTFKPNEGAKYQNLGSIPGFATGGMVLAESKEAQELALLRRLEHVRNKKKIKKCAKEIMNLIAYDKDDIKNILKKYFK